MASSLRSSLARARLARGRRALLLALAAALLTLGSPAGVGDSAAHPLVWGNAPVPLNIQYLFGSYRAPNGVWWSVNCGVELGTDTPRGPQGDTRYISYVGSARCSIPSVTHSGQPSLYGWPGTYYLTQAPSYSGVPAANVSIYSTGYYTRASDQENEQIKHSFSITLPAWDGANWNTLPGGCSGYQTRTASCTLWSMPFKYAPNPVDPQNPPPLPQACPLPQLGVQPNCVPPPPPPQPPQSTSPPTISGTARDARR